MLRTLVHRGHRDSIDIPILLDVIAKPDTRLTDICYRRLLSTFYHIFNMVVAVASDSLSALTSNIPALSYTRIPVLPLKIVNFRHELLKTWEKHELAHS